MISDLRFYLSLLPRRLPVMAMLFLVSAIASVIIAQRLPPMYSTSATLLVESPQISEDLVRSTVQVTASEQLQVIQQRLLTRSNLLDIARELRVFADQSTMTPDEIVRAMRDATNISLSIGRDQATLMVIGFVAGNPQTVSDVVNKYVNIALETNSAFRTNLSEDTLSFFEQEVQRLSDQLGQQNAKIVQFKNESADALPENLEFSLDRRSLLQERLSRSERDKQSLEAQRANIQRIYEATGIVNNTGNRQLSPEEAQFNQLEAELRVARSVYAPTSPRIRNLQAQVDALRAQLDATTQGAGEGEGEPLNPQSAALTISLAEIDGRLADAEQDIEDTTEELAILQDSIGRTPAIGIVLSGMEREHENTQALYNAAVSRLAQAQASQRVELSSKGERITVLEAASVPSAPSSPNRTKIAAFGVLIGLGLAAGFFVLLELLNQTIRRSEDIMRALDVTPLATLPPIETKADKRWRRAKLVVSILVVTAAVPTALWAIDTYYMPLDLLFEKIKNRLT